MVEIVIAGIGQTPVGELWDVSLRALAVQAIKAALQDCGNLQPQTLFVANMLAPALSGQAHLGALIADAAGLTGIEAVCVEAAGASGGAAVRQASLAIAAGAADVALVVGVEKFTDRIGSSVEAALSNVTDNDFEAAQGLTLAAQAALLLQRYQYEYAVPREAFAGFPIVAHANGVHNPNAMFRKAIDIRAYQRAGMESAALNLFDSAPNADGAAVVILARSGLLPPGFPHPLLRISGVGLVTERLALHDRTDPLEFRAARLSVERACRQAGILPTDADLFELHDAYSIFTALSLEAAGLAERGGSCHLAQSGDLELHGRVPIATFGGLKARGNPGGASGVYQIVEAALQLRGEAGENQVPGARRALVQCLGGPASVAVTHVIERI